MDYPNCRNWQAEEAQDDFGGGPWTLSVTGEVEVSGSDPAYTLYQRDEEGERIRLQLDTVQLSGSAAAEPPASDPGATWLKVGFKKTGLPGPVYNQVMVLYEDFIVGDCGVEVIHSAAGQEAQAPDGPALPRD